MSEAPTAAAAPALDPAQIAAYREHWVSHGYDPAAFDAAMNPAPPKDPGAPAAPAAPEPRAVEASSVDVYDPGAPTLSAAEIASARETWISLGYDPAEFEAALKADGHEVVADVPDTRTDEQREWDWAFAPGAPEEYRINYAARLDPGANPAQLAQANAETTQWLAAVGFPVEIGPAVAERGMDVSRQLQRMSGPERELWKAAEGVKFVRMAGSDERAAELKTFAAEALKRGGAPFAQTLENAGVLYDAGFIMHLALQGERLKARG